MQKPEKPYDFFHVYDYDAPDIFAEDMMMARGFDSREDAWVYWDLKHSSGEYKDYLKAKKQYESEQREQPAPAYSGRNAGGAVYRPSPEEVQEARSGCLRGFCYLLVSAFIVFMGFKAALATERLDMYYQNYYLCIKGNDLEEADKYREKLPGWWKDTKTLDIWQEARETQESSGSEAALTVIERIPEDYQGEGADEIRKYKQRLRSAK